MTITSLKQIDEGRLAYSPLEVATMVGSTRGRIFRAISQGRLNAKRNGNEILILRDDLLDWLAKLPVRSSISDRRHGGSHGTAA